MGYAGLRELSIAVSAIDPGQLHGKNQTIKYKPHH